MQSVGTRLRDARVKKGYTLDDIHARTRITLKNVEAIESDDLSKISSPFTYRAFVRQIAEAIGIDSEALAPDALAASSSMPEPLVPGQGNAKIVRNVPIQARVKNEFSWSHPAFLVFAVAAIAAVGYVWSRSGNVNTREYSARVADLVGARMKTLAPEKTAPRVEVPKPPRMPTAQVIAPEPTKTVVVPGIEELALQAKTAVTPPPVPVTAPPEPVQQPEMAPVAERMAEPKTVPEPVESYTFPAASGSDKIHIELSATEPTWLSIVADGKETYTGTLDISEIKVLDGHDTAKIRTGNAGGVSITFNGRLLGTLGRHGQARTFVFTKTGYEVMQPPTASLEMTRLSPSGE